MINHNNKKNKNKIQKTNYVLVFLTFIFLVAVAPILSLALEVTENPQAPVEDRFAVGPAKVELLVSPGGTVVTSIEVENRTGRTGIYEFSFEDFVGGSDGNVALLGDEKSQFSLKDFVSVESSSITLKHGDRVQVPVTVSVPQGITPGGKFVSLLVSSRVSTPTDSSESSGAKVVGRVAVLFFVTIAGDVDEDGGLESFRVARDQKFVRGDEVVFQVGFENRGNVHLNPYGVITVRNIFGKKVSEIIVDPWFVLPDSFRTRDISLSTDGKFGWHRATLELNRGYENVIDTKEVKFVVFSNLQIILLFAALGGVLYLWLKKKTK